MVLGSALEPTRSAPAIRREFVRLFPGAFRGRKQPKIPLKAGIIDDLARAMPDYPKTRLEWVLGIYTDGPTYLREIIEGRARVDLYGNPVGMVTAAQETAAKAKLAALGFTADGRAEWAPPPSDMTPAAQTSTSMSADS